MSMRAIALSLAAFLAVTVVALPEASAIRVAPSADEAIEALLGTWRLANRTRAVEARDAGVEAVVQEMGLIARPIARRRLRRGLTPPGRLVIARASNGKLRFAVGDYSVTAAPGETVAFTDPEGNSGRMRVSIRNGRLRQRFFLDDSSVLTHTITTTRRGARLTVRVAHDRLPSDVRYTAMYVKQPQRVRRRPR